MDILVRRLVLKTPNLAVPHYLIACYLYYVMDAAVIEDDTFDWLGKFLGEHWDTIRHHHKHLLDREFLKSGFHIQYPDRVRYAAEEMLRHAGRTGPIGHGTVQGAVP